MKNSKTALYDCESMNTALNLVAGQKGGPCICAGKNVSALPLPLDECSKALMELNLLRIENSKFKQRIDELIFGEFHWKKESMNLKEKLEKCEEKINEGQPVNLLEENKKYQNEIQELKEKIRQSDFKSQKNNEENDKLRRENLELRLRNEDLLEKIRKQDMDIEKISQGDPEKIMILNAVKEKNYAESENYRLKRDLKNLEIKIDELSKSPEKPISVSAQILKENIDLKKELEQKDKTILKQKSELDNVKETPDKIEAKYILCIKERDLCEAQKIEKSAINKELTKSLSNIEKSPEAQKSIAANALLNYERERENSLNCYNKLAEQQQEILNIKSSSPNIQKSEHAKCIIQLNQAKNEVENANKRTVDLINNIEKLVGDKGNCLENNEKILTERSQIQNDLDICKLENENLKKDYEKYIKSNEPDTEKIAKLLNEKSECYSKLHKSSKRIDYLQDAFKKFTTGADPSKMPLGVIIRENFELAKLAEKQTPKLEKCISDLNEVTKIMEGIQKGGDSTQQEAVKLAKENLKLKNEIQEKIEEINKNQGNYQENAENLNEIVNLKNSLEECKKDKQKLENEIDILKIAPGKESEKIGKSGKIEGDFEKKLKDFEKLIESGSCEEIKPEIAKIAKTLDNYRNEISDLNNIIETVNKDLDSEKNKLKICENNLEELRKNKNICPECEEFKNKNLKCEENLSECEKEKNKEKTNCEQFIILSDHCKNELKECKEENKNLKIEKEERAQKEQDKNNDIQNSIKKLKELGIDTTDENFKNLGPEQLIPALNIMQNEYKKCVADKANLKNENDILKANTTDIAKDAIKMSIDLAKCYSDKENLLADTKNINENLEKCKSELNSNQNLIDQAKIAENAVKTANAEKENCNSELTKLRDLFKEMTNERDTCIKNNTEIIENCKENSIKLAECKANLNKCTEDLDKKLNDYSTKLSNTENALKSCMDNMGDESKTQIALQDLQGKYATLSKENEKCKEDIKKISDEAEANKKSNVDLVENLKTCSEKLEKTNKDISELNEKLTNSDTTLRNCLENKGQLSEKINEGGSVKNEYEKCKEELKNQKEINENINKSNVELIENLKNSAEKLDKANKELKECNENFDNKIHDLNEKYQNCDSALKNCLSNKGDIAETLNENQIVKNENSKLQKEAENLREQNYNLTQNLQDLNRTNLDLIGNLNERINDIAKCKDDLKINNENHDKIIKEISENNEKCKDDLKKCVANLGDKEKNNEIVQGLIDEKNNLAKENEKCKEDVKKSNENLEDSKKTNGVLMEKMKNYAEESENMQKKLKDCTENFEKTGKELLDEKAEHSKCEIIKDTLQSDIKKSLEEKGITDKILLECQQKLANETMRADEAVRRAEACEGHHQALKDLSQKNIEDIEHMENRVLECQKEEKMRTEEIGKLKAENEKCKNGLDILESLSLKLAKALANQTETSKLNASKCVEVINKNNELLEEKMKLIAENNNNAAKINELEQNNMNLTTSIEDLEKKLVNLNTELENKGKDTENLIQECAKTNNTLTIVEAELRQTGERVTKDWKLVDQLLRLNKLLKDTVTQCIKGSVNLAMKDETVPLGEDYKLTPDQVRDVNKIIAKFLEEYNIKSTATPNFNILIGFIDGSDPGREFTLELYHKRENKRFSITFYTYFLLSYKIYKNIGKKKNWWLNN